MDDLFVIDTQGSKNVAVETTAVDREFKAVTLNRSSRPNTKPAKGIPRARVIEDHIQTAATSSSSGPGDAHSGSMRGLNSQFLSLGVNEKKRKNNPRNKYGKVKGKGGGNKNSKDGVGYRSNQPRINRNKRPPKQQDMDEDERVSASIIDFMDNLGKQGIMELMARTPEYNGPSYVNRDLGGGSGVNPGPGPDGEDDDESGPDDALKADDPYRFEDELVDSILYGADSSSAASASDDEGLSDYASNVFANEDLDEDDGIPIDIDMESLADPDTRSSRRSKTQKHVQKVQSVRAFKEKDRLKSKNSHAKQKGGKGKGKDSDDGPSPGFNPRTVIGRLEILTRNTDFGSIWLQPMNTYERRIVHILAKEYGINSKSHGNGSNRSTILTPTPSTCKPRNTKRIDKLLLLFDEGGLIPQQWCGGPTPKEGRGAGAGKKAGRAGKAGKAGKSGSSSSQSGKKMVAEDAPAVGASNIGHQMLTQMGWAPGQGLGANQEGRSTPVDVMIRSGRQGLGA